LYPHPDWILHQFYHHVPELFRDDKELNQIPICIITGKPELRKLIYEHPIAPPEGYLDKPVSEDGILLNIRKIFEVGKHDKVEKH